MARGAIPVGILLVWFAAATVAAQEGNLPVTDTLITEYRADNKNVLDDDDDYGVVVNRLNLNGSAGDLTGQVRVDSVAFIEEPSDDAFHEWRKRAQFHRRHVALLAAAWPDALEARVTVCRQLSEQLGLDHDLSVLAAFVMSPQGRPATKRDARELLSICQREQHELRNAACAVGALLTAENPPALRQRVEAYWTVRSDKAIDLREAAE